MIKSYLENKNNLQKFKIFFTICGGLIISVPTTLSLGTNIANAQQVPSQSNYPTQSQPLMRVNPCPRIFYEEPHNNRVLVPQGCPPNAITRRYAAQGLNTTPVQAGNPTPEQIRLGIGGEVPTSQAIPNQTVPTQIPSPEQQQNVVATVTPTNNTVNVRLVNETNAPITYQAIGNTAQRILPGKSSVTLRSLSTPTTVTFYRSDRGLIQASPESTSEGTLQLTLRETTDFKTDRTSLRIENNGNVFLN